MNPGGADERLELRCSLGPTSARRWLVVRGAVIEVADLALFPGGAVQEERVGGADGHVRRFAEDRHLLEEGDLLQGKPHGRWTRYGPAGAVAEEWTEPRAAPSEAKGSAEVTANPDEEELYGGQRLAWWRIRLATLSSMAKKDPSLAPLEALTVERAKLAGLRLDSKTDRLEAP
jgi:hypothetical protein